MNAYEGIFHGMVSSSSLYHVTITCVHSPLAHLHLVYDNALALAYEGIFHGMVSSSSLYHVTITCVHSPLAHLHLVYDNALALAWWAHVPSQNEGC